MDAFPSQSPKQVHGPEDRRKNWRRKISTLIRNLIYVRMKNSEFWVRERIIGKESVQMIS